MTDKIDPKQLVVGDTYPTRNGTATILGFPSKEALDQADAMRDKAIVNKHTMKAFYVEYEKRETALGKELKEFWTRVSKELGMSDDELKNDPNIMVDDTHGAVVRLVIDSSKGPPRDEKETACCGDQEGECQD